MANSPIICFGQQPCGFFPRRFLFAKIQTARRVQQEIGGRIVFFYHDSDHDPRETQTILKNRSTGKEQRLNFSFANKVQKKYSPLYAKRVDPAWKDQMARQLPQYVKGGGLLDAFEKVRADNVAEFCLEMYQALGLIDGIEIARSSDPAFRDAACPVDDYYVDVTYEDEIARARLGSDKCLWLHKGGGAYIDLPKQSWRQSQISPARDTRLVWMQSVIKCTHYIAGASEIDYLDTSETPMITFIRRDDISDSSGAYVP
jgi:hypothetical protein